MFEAEIDENPASLIDKAEQSLYEIAEKGAHSSGFMPFEESLAGAIEMAERAYQREGHLSGISTGFRGLDDMLGGFQESDLIILAGRPGMGKTALATNVAFSIANDYLKAQTSGNTETLPDGTVKVKDGGVVGFFSLEMSAEQLATRMLAERSGVSSSNIRKGDIHEDEYGRLVAAARDLNDAPLFIDHTGAIPIATLAARARRLKRQRGLGLIVVDYLQLVRASNTRSNDGRVQEVSEITQGLKALAKELNVPVLALAQLSRQVETRDDKRPLLADLRESGSIEQDADIVMFVYREPYYLAREKPTEGTEEFMRWQSACRWSTARPSDYRQKPARADGHAKWPLKIGLHASPIWLKTTICQSVMTDPGSRSPDCAQVTVDLAALGRNYETMRDKSGGRGAAVIKADAYGWG